MQNIYLQEVIWNIFGTKGNKFILVSGGSRISPGGGANIRFLPNFSKNCTTFIEFGPRAEGARPKFYCVDPPLLVVPLLIEINFTMGKVILSNMDSFQLICTYMVPDRGNIGPCFFLSFSTVTILLVEVVPAFHATKN